jgi:hypothetical protein
MSPTRSKPATRGCRSKDPRIEALRRLYAQLGFYTYDGPGARAEGFWKLPPRGLYAGGCKTGSAAAFAYLKFMREKKKLQLDAGIFGFLQSLVIDMVKGVRQNESLKGQMVGFFSEIDRVIYSVANQMSGLDKISFDSLTAQMREGVAYTKADEEKMARDIRSRIAKDGWEKRRRRAGKPAGRARIPTEARP